MSASALRSQASSGVSAFERCANDCKLDFYLIGVVLAIIFIGIVMVGSASITTADRNLGAPFYYLQRQLLFASLGFAIGMATFYVPTKFWWKMSTPLFLFGFVLLALVLIPGIGKSVNGSMRWVPLGVINVQVSEIVKLFAITYMAGYLMRHGELLRSTSIKTSFLAFLKPMILILIAIFMLLLEPDFGASVVLLAVAMGMMFLGGARLWQFASLLLIAVASFAALAITSPYRMERITAFLNPFADPFNSGFQLTQALVAIGSGEWFGVGLGSSIQKLFYLPEAHTDFLFSVMAEELGLMGALIIIGLFLFVIWRAFLIGNNALKIGQYFSAYVAFGIGIWIGLQSFINMGVNMGVLPTKGLTLPFMSYGGSSMIVMCITMALLIRIDHEVRTFGETNRSNKRGSK